MDELGSHLQTILRPKSRRKTNIYTQESLKQWYIVMILTWSKSYAGRISGRGIVSIEGKSKTRLKNAGSRVRNDFPPLSRANFSKAMMDPEEYHESLWGSSRFWMDFIWIWGVEPIRKTLKATKGEFGPRFQCFSKSYQTASEIVWVL